MILDEAFFEELSSKLLSCGLPCQQVQSYIARYKEDYKYGFSSYDMLDNHQIPSDDCCRTLAEAQKILAADTHRSEFSQELSNIVRFLRVPFSKVEAAKNAIMACFDCSADEVDSTYYQDTDWLFITADSVNEFSILLKSRFNDPDLVWRIYQKAALLGLEKSRIRIDSVLKMLGRDIGENVIRTDVNGKGWLFYPHFTDPVGCIAYMLKCELAPEKILHLIECEPNFLFEYKAGRKRKYFHDQDYIDLVIQKYAK